MCYRYAQVFGPQVKIFGGKRYAGKGCKKGEFAGKHRNSAFGRSVRQSENVGKGSQYFSGGKHNGFTVEFDTDGGSQIQSVKAYHSELLDVSEQPVKEGYTFTGWYTDRACTDKWDMAHDTVTQSMTLYAGWEKNT